MSTTFKPADLSRVPLEYHDFADVFSKSKTSQLAPHHEHDLKINLKEETSPPLGCTYSLSTFELESLWTFLDEHLANSFIRPSYLWIYCNYQQDNWSELLPLVEFSYNNALNATTGVSPFFANKGYHPNLSVHPE